VSLSLYCPMAPRRPASWKGQGAPHSEQTPDSLLGCGSLVSCRGAMAPQLSPYTTASSENWAPPHTDCYIVPAPPMLALG
jgi:hypothetical protein